jgi:glycosyltransferase involved in cell wall biosynthesis
MRPTIAAIVPAYNEEKRLRSVLGTIVTSGFFSEIICINDGSTDNTQTIIELFPTIRSVRLKSNAVTHTQLREASASPRVTSSY